MDSYKRHKHTLIVCKQSLCNFPVFPVRLHAIGQQGEGFLAKWRASMPGWPIFRLGEVESEVHERLLTGCRLKICLPNRFVLLHAKVSLKDKV